MSDSVQPHRQQPTRLPRPWDSPGKNTGVGCHFLLQCMKVKSENEVAQSCPTLCDSIDGSPPGSWIPGILQARTLEWVAISFSTNARIRMYKYLLLSDACQVKEIGAIRAKRKINVTWFQERKERKQCYGILSFFFLRPLCSSCSILNLEIGVFM